MADVRRRQDNIDRSLADEPLNPRNAEMDRRGFLSAATLAVLGIAAAYPSLVPSSAWAVVREDVAVPAWKPISQLAKVSVAANASAKGYPALVPGAAFNTHPAVVLLENSLKGLSGGSAVEAIQAAVAPGGTVLIKPNWVEPGKWATGKITHPSLVIAAARFAAEAVGPTGHVFIGEGTSEGRDLPRILAATTFMHAMEEFGLDEATSTRARVQVVDLNVASVGTVLVKLRGLSRFSGVHDKLYDASGRTLGRMGDGHIGSYRIARPIIDADLVIDFAKSKVHCSAGATLALKNFLGIVPTSHDPSGAHRLKSVPHYSAGDAAGGRKYVLNRTIGRTSADLHACAMYVARDGSLQRSPQRKLLCIIDGVISGQNTQFAPQPVGTGWVVAGYDPVAVDNVASRCMGFDPARLESIKAAAKGSLSLGTANPGNVQVTYSGPGTFGGYFTSKRALRPESVVAKWGRSISLGTLSIKAPAVSHDRKNVVFDAVPAGAFVRLYSDTDFATLKRTGSGVFSADLSTRPTGSVRAAVMDAHFNVWDGIVRA
jgi:uncharacterized protein (DUF362 family)